MARPSGFRRHDEASRELAAWGGSHDPDENAFARARRIARRLGAHLAGDRVEFGFWLPQLEREGVDPDRVELELFLADEPIRWGEPQELTMRTARIRCDVEDGFAWVAVSGLPPGSRDAFGAFYRVRYTTGDGDVNVVYDPLAYSLPFGIHAPAELYDIDRLQVDRPDREFFRRHAIGGSDDEPSRFGPPANILQLHVGTATGSGTLAELADLYRALGEKVAAGAELTPAEANFVGYDAVQLMPVEPVIEPAGANGYFRIDGEGDEVRVRLRPPDTTNWGYDIAIAGSAAVNPAILRSGRPDELADLAAVLHTFPGKPMRLIFDLVFGHSDNQGLELLPAEFFAGANMYGQDMRFRHPMVRAIMLEMQRRKVDFGADGVRVDGAQDFKYWDEEAQQVRYDDAYLREMSAIVQRVADVDYLPFMIFEDGRPWPREDWETASTYRDVIDDQPHTFQWGPLTFAHNTPCLTGFWGSKWWRIEEIVGHGGHWINGCANHDTLRRGYQIALDREINRRLGATLPEILRKSYDHPAASLLTYGIFPGIPMEFIAATMRAPWAFIRNTDTRYGVKVVAEEAGFLDWRADPHRYAQEGSFARMKGLGFGDLDALRAFMADLAEVVANERYDLEALAAALARRGSAAPLLGGGDAASEFTGAALARFAHAFMEDLHDYCLVWRFEDELDPSQVGFNRALREFRRGHGWLMRDFGDGDALERRVEADGSTLASARRASPDGSEAVLLIANLEGEPFELVPAALPLLTGETDLGGWRVAVASPHLDASDDLHAPLRLADAEGVLYYREQ